jgi:transaldolase/glucose-6-phosphate isomerase
MPTLQELDACGQSVWLDYIRRGFVTGGELAALICDGLKGLTSNPYIFEKAMGDSDEYRNDIARCKRDLRAAGR